MVLLLEYAIDKKKDSNYRLKFTTVDNTIVSYSYDSSTNINYVTLSTEQNTKTKFTKEFSSTDGKLQISFIQNGSSSSRTALTPPTGKPVIIIDDGEGDL